jgi:hypothetical protein
MKLPRAEYKSELTYPNDPLGLLVLPATSPWREAGLRKLAGDPWWPLGVRAGGLGQT